MYRIGFILEQALGHVTHTKNLMANVPSDSEVTPYWGLVPWETRGPAARLPLYRSNWTVRAGLRARGVVRKLAQEAARETGAGFRFEVAPAAPAGWGPGRDRAGSRRQGRPGLDVLFFHTQVTAVLAADWLRRVPGVVSLDATPIQFDQLGEYYGHAAGPEFVERYKWRLNRDCLRAARHLVAWAAWTKRGLVADYEVPAGKITVIPPGVNVAEWRRPTPRVRREGPGGPGAIGDGVGGVPVKILFVGANLDRKGGRVLLDAFRRLTAEAARGEQRSGATGNGLNSAPDLELHLVTHDAVPAERGLFVYNDISPNSDRLKRLYHECDIFCLPTFGDCLPMVLSEAGAAGLPAVTTDVAGIPEIVRDGESGFLTPPGDAEALAAALRRLICDEELRLRLGTRATEVVSLDFDAARNTARLLDLLKQVGHSAGPGGDGQSRDPRRGPSAGEDDGPERAGELVTDSSPAEERA